jgi:hypothetical protein
LRFLVRLVELVHTSAAIARSCASTTSPSQLAITTASTIVAGKPLVTSAESTTNVGALEPVSALLPWTQRPAADQTKAEAKLLPTCHVQEKNDRRIARDRGILAIELACRCSSGRRVAYRTHMDQSPVLVCICTGPSKKRNVEQEKSKTYSSEDSRVVTHRSTNSPVSCLCMAERTGCALSTF